MPDAECRVEKEINCCVGTSFAGATRWVKKGLLS
jgi:hypothetical protein